MVKLSGPSPKIFGIVQSTV